MKKFFVKIVNVIAPPRCLLCGEILSESKNGICYKCIKNFHFIEEPYCEICSMPFYFDRDEMALANGEKSRHVCGNCSKKKPHYDRAFSIFKYDAFSKKILMPLKHGDETNLARFVGEMMVRRFADEINKCDFIVPVPIHNLRYKVRKYNQALLIANKVAADSKKPILRECLFRLKFNASQGHLSTRKRFENVKNSFAMNVKFSSSIKGKTILLVDDVCTTGATVDQCARVLKNNGALRVVVISFAKTTFL